MVRMRSIQIPIRYDACGKCDSLSSEVQDTGMDGRFLIYFDITSKQAVNVLYEEKKMGVEDLRLIFGGFVKAMEDAAEYLINPGQFIMSPEYIYTDIEKDRFISV